MRVYVNSEPHELPEGSTLADLLEAVGAPQEGIAVEVDRNLVRRAEHASHVLSPEAQVEVVGLVGGG